MGTITMSVKRLRCIAGRWFWRPSKSLREQGYKNLPLGSDFVRAIEAAKQLNAQVDGSGAEMPRNATGSIAAIIKLYTEDERFTERAESTRRTYQCALREIEKEFGRTPIVTVQRPHLIAMYRKLKGRGKGIARLHMVVWQNLFDVAINEGLRRADDNPARNMRLPKGEKRTRKWTEAEMTAFREAAVAAGRPSLALAMICLRPWAAHVRRSAPHLGPVERLRLCPDAIQDQGGHRGPGSVRRSPRPASAGPSPRSGRRPICRPISRRGTCAARP
jgi:hypothetical protein